MRYRLRYKKSYVTFPTNPRKGVCEACGKSVHEGEIKRTQIHHYRYKYAIKTVKKKPELALENTVELDYYCHRIADALRVLYSSDNNRIMDVILSHPTSFINKISEIWE